MRADKIIFDHNGACHNGDNRHAQKAMRDLGVAYKLAVPQTISDSWWFLGCESVPEELPSYIKVGEVESFHSLVGWGLSREHADMLEEWRSNDTD